MGTRSKGQPYDGFKWLVARGSAPSDSRLISVGCTTLPRLYGGSASRRAPYAPYLCPSLLQRTSYGRLLHGHALHCCASVVHANDVKAEQVAHVCQDPNGFRAARSPGDLMTIRSVSP